MSEVIIVLITAPSRETADSISKSLVELRLAACVNILPNISSVFHWEGKVDWAEEFLLIAKTKKSAFKDLEEKVLESHPYDTPEIISISVSDGTRAYMDWILKETI